MFVVGCRCCYLRFSAAVVKKKMSTEREAIYIPRLYFFFPESSFFHLILGEKVKKYRVFPKKENGTLWAVSYHHPAGSGPVVDIYGTDWPAFKLICRPFLSSLPETQETPSMTMG